MEEIEIPSHFICPISLQLMRDPVTISTGITYDRHSIEKWIFTCNNNICPLTKQIILKEEDDDVMITPNHTLRRLIQSWSTLHASNGVERVSTPKQPPIVDRTLIGKLLSDSRRSPELRYTCLQRIRSLLASYELRTKKLLKGSGIFHYIASIIITEEDHDTTKEDAIFILSQLDPPQTELTRLFDDDSFIDSLTEFLRGGSHEGRESCIKLLKSLYNVANPNQSANATLDLFVEIVNVIRDGQTSHQATKYGLKLLVELIPWGRNRVKAVESGAISALVELLINNTTGSDRRVSELALVVLDKLCGCAEGRAELVAHAAGLAVVSKKILRVSHVASDRAVKILSSISRYSATTRVVGEMMEVGVVAKLCLVIQVDCSLKTKERAKEILRLHSRVWRMSPCIPHHLLSSYPI